MEPGFGSQGLVLVASAMVRMHTGERLIVGCVSFFHAFKALDVLILSTELQTIDIEPTKQKVLGTLGVFCTCLGRKNHRSRNSEN